MYTTGNPGNSISYRILEHHFRDNAKNQYFSPEEVNELTYWHKASEITHFFSRREIHLKNLKKI